MLDKINNNNPSDQTFVYKIDNFDKPNKSNKKISIRVTIIFVFFILFICGAFGFWYYKGEAMFLISEMKFPWGTDVKNYSNKTKINIGFQKLDDAMLSEFLSSFVGSNIGESGSIDIEYDFKNVYEDTESYVQFVLNNNPIIKFSIKTFDKESIYSKIDLSDNIPFLEGPKDQWVYYSIKQEPTNFLNFYFNKLIEMDLTQKEQKLKMMHLSKFFDINDPHSKKYVNGQSVKEIKLKIKKDKAIDLVLILVKNFSSDDVYNKFYNKYENYKLGKDEEFGKSINILNTLSDKLDISIFVDKKSKTIYGIYLYINDLDILKLINPESNNSQKINTAFSTEFNKLENYTIEEPRDAISMENIINNFNDYSIEVIELKDSDKDGLLDIYEEKYNSDINNSDTDKDGYIDGFEVINGYNPNGSGELNDDKNIFYFAYGPAMNMENMIDLYGENNFISFGSSVLSGYDFYFYKDTSSNIKVSKDKNVYGVLYKINEKLLNVMDKSSLVLYNKNILKVKNNLGEFDAVVYTAKDSITTSVPDLYYLTVLVSGAKQNGLPEDYINLLNNYSSNKISINFVDENSLKLKANTSKIYLDIRAILMALQMYYVDTGIIPESIKSGDCLSDNNEICSNIGSKCSELVDLSVLINKGILNSIPINPIKTNKETGYFVSRDSQNNITVCANSVESDEPISFTEKLISK
ncbi:MAG: gamma-glutamylcyclotransferase [Patescibacteria group bacterium]|nr:gamma-glutamylcyclotransferase [Patescibacteria group bacterium]MDD4304533.1 gamma-glutamylcyclotransferase [Patescibacteria group bacterium]MDD4695641.1 gamma-glutamylcyclotransferase [Patescibacteria group bacterium]